MKGPWKVGVIVAALVTLVAALPGRAAASDLLVGVADDLFKVDAARAFSAADELGTSAVRITIPWRRGEQVPDLSAVVAHSGAVRLFVAVYGHEGADAPRTAAARAEYRASLTDLTGRYPAVRDVIVWNEPNHPSSGIPRATLQSAMRGC